MSRFWRALLGVAVIAVALPATAAAGVSTTGKPSISGTAKVGQTLTCNGPAWTSDDGGTPVAVRYDWYHADDQNNPIDTEFGFPATKTYKLVGSDAGHQIQCTQTEEDSGNGDFSETTSGFSNPTAAVAPGAPPTTTGQTAVSGTPQAGNTLFCQGPTWHAAGNGFDFVETSDSWYYTTDTNTPLSGGSDTSAYTVKQADVGHKIVCIETATDDQTGGQAQSSSPALTILPTAGITFTQYSPKVSGTIGEAANGVSVHLTLERFAGINVAPRTVATATTTTNASGNWSATLTPSVAGADDAFAVDGDQLVVTYSGGPAGTVLPSNTTYDENSVDFAGSNTTISSDGGTVVSSAGFNCTSVKILVDGTANNTTSANGQCKFSPAAPLTDNNHVQTQFTNQLTDPTANTVSNVTTLSDVGLLGVGFNSGQGEGAPTCTADLVSGQVICEGLSGKTFTVTNGTSTATLTNVQQSSHNGFVEDEGSGFLTGLAAGQTVILKESGLARALTTLNLVTLRVDYDLGGNASGSCQPNKMFGGGFETELCPVNGTFSNGGNSLFDDLSGGQTVVNVPTIGNRIPSSLDSIAGGTFTAYGDLFNVGTAAQVLSQTKSISLSIVPHAGGNAAFSGTTTNKSDALGPFAFDNVSGLALGRYFANWGLTDSHGDTRRYSDEFAVQPANTGPAGAPGPAGAQGPAGPAGAQGPAGKDGSSSLTKCTTKKTGKGKHKKTHTKCTTTVVAPGSHTVSVAITRGRRMLASGSAVVRSGIAHVTIRRAGRLRHGRYLVTVLSSTGSKTTILRRYERL
jgi:hypothetical protein